MHAMSATGSCQIPKSVGSSLVRSEKRAVVKDAIGGLIFVFCVFNIRRRRIARKFQMGMFYVS